MNREEFGAPGFNTGTVMNFALLVKSFEVVTHMAHLALE